MTDRQLDISGVSDREWSNIPRSVPGRLNGQDFIHFNWPNCGFDPSRYTIVIESLDNAGDMPFRSISKLRKSVEIPLVQLGQYGRVGVVPDTDKLPLFESVLIRGSTYVIPDVRGNGRYQMVRHGMYRPNGV